MKNLKILIILFSIANGLCAQWSAGTYPPGTFRIDAIDMTSTTTGFIVGSNSLFDGAGIIRKTTNAGQSWTTGFTDPDQQLSDIFFVNDNLGFAVGTGGLICRTTNGGDSWTSYTYQNNNGFSDDVFYGVHFPSESVGYAVGGFDIEWAAKTVDGGNTWSELNLPTDVVQRLFGAYFTDENTGYLVGGSSLGGNLGRIFKTTNGGDSWDIYVPDNPTYFNGVEFLNASTGIAFGANGTILKTTNAGATWVQQENQDPDMNDITDMYFLNQEIGYACTLLGKILKTVNSGETWTVDADYSSQFYSFSELDVTNGSFGLAVGILPSIAEYSGTAVSIAEISSVRDILIYPNPVNDFVSIDLKLADEYTFKIFDQNGNIVLENYVNGSIISLDLSGIASGPYFMEVMNKRELFHVKLVKM